MKTTARNAVFAVSDHAQRIPRRVSVFRGPAVSEAGIVFDMFEIRVDIPELFADTLDEGTYIGPIPLPALPGDEVFAVDQIINLSIADVLSGLVGEQGEDLEFGQGQVDDAAR